MNRLYRFLIPLVAAWMLCAAPGAARTGAEAIPPARGQVALAPGAVEPDAAMTEMLAPYAKQVAKWNELIGHADQTLPRSSDDRELGSFICDAFQTRLESLGKPVDFTVFNTGGIRSTLDEGPITYRSIASILPFENTAVLIEATPDQVDELVAFMAKNRRNVVSRLDIHADDEGNVISYTFNGKPLDRTRNYRFATNNYLALGGDGFAFWTEWTQHDTEILVRDMVADQIREMTSEGKHVTAAADARRFHWPSKEATQ